MEILALPFSAVTGMEQFIRARWMHMGGDGGLDGIEAAGGPAANTIRRLCEAPGIRQRKSDSQDRLAIFLGFDHWDDLMAAFHHPDTKGVRWKLGYVRLPDDAYKTAVGAAKGRGVSVEDWVGEAVREKAKGK